MPSLNDLNRRDFLRRTSVVAGAGVAALGAAASRGVCIIADPADPVASSAPGQWAVKELGSAFAQHSVTAHLEPSLDRAAAGDLCILVAGAAATAAQGILRGARVAAPTAPEAMALVSSRSAGKPVLLLCGSDSRGVVYAVREAADRVRLADDPFLALQLAQPVMEHPANAIRSVTRLFVSDVEDKPWYNDREMWPPYLSMLAAQRFNRFNLAFGIGYDFPRQLTDVYLYFAYPFLVSVPGYNVRARGLPDAERDHNLEMLRYISDEAEARGLHFQLGIWTHGYEWIDSPKANYVIEGVTPQNQASYCRDALYTVLQACPSIRGVTLRVHGESGVQEGDYGFWKTLFDGILRTGRKIEIDMHAKGMDQNMLNTALTTGLPVNVSPKYWAEHMGLPYHQASIREQEMPSPTRKGVGLMALSSGERSFLRYGYGDLLTAGRRYGVLHRIWPGTQRLLMWGDPAIAASFGRASSFCGSVGVEICEPLSFKGRKGSGLPGGRCAYADTSLNPRWDWEKYLYSYRLWGRLLYDPESDPEVWRRYLRNEFGGAANASEAALANASRILPLVTTAHGASGANNSYWPEVYTNMGIVNTGKPQPYNDTPQPKKFGAVSPFDPELFGRIDDFADGLLKGEHDWKYSPIEVAQWLEDFAEAGSKSGAEAESRGGASRSAAFRRLHIDAAIQTGLGRFFAMKIRSAVLYRLHEQTADRSALEEALKAYRGARAAWAATADRAKPVYVPDITVGNNKALRGHWADRLAGIDEDIADMENRLAQAKETGSEAVKQAIREALRRPVRPVIACHHAPPASFRPGNPVEIAASVDKLVTVRLHYRRVNQAERFKVEEMQARDKNYTAVIPAEYTKSPYHLQYYFELRESPLSVRLYPSLEPPAWGQPYFVIQQG